MESPGKTGFGENNLTQPAATLVTTEFEEQLKGLAEFRYLLRSFLSFSETSAEAEDITAQQYQLLQVVGAAGPGGASISLVAQRMLLRHNSAVELVDRAERCTLVRRTADEADLRRSIVRLTPRGEELLVRLVGAHVRYLESSAGPLIAAMNGLLPSGDR